MSPNTTTIVLTVGCHLVANIYSPPGEQSHPYSANRPGRHGPIQGFSIRVLFRCRDSPESHQGLSTVSAEKVQGQQH